MVSFLRTLLMLSVLSAPTSSLCLRLSPTPSDLLCGVQGNGVQGNGVQGNGVPSGSMTDSWGSLLHPADALSGEAREKRTYPAGSNYRFLSQTQLRSKMFQNSAKSDRRSKFSLSLDVPTNIMNILFDIAKSKNLRAKAADNARLMAQIGRRK